MSLSGDSNHRMAGFRQRIDGVILRRIRPVFQTDVGEHAVVAVDFGRSQRLAIHRNDSLAVLAGGFGHQLLEPGAEIPNAAAK